MSATTSSVGQVGPFDVVVNGTVDYNGQLSTYLRTNGASLRNTLYPNVFLIKFDQSTNVKAQGMRPLRGLMFNKETHEIVSVTFPVPVEVKDLSPEEKASAFAEMKSHEADGYVVHEALDATLIRLGVGPVGWMVSTNGKEDAEDAFWMGGKSFGQMFWDAMPDDFDTSLLNRNYIYQFLLCHPSNIIVVNHQKPVVYHATTFDRTTLKEVACDTIIPHLPVLPHMTIDQIVEATTNCLGKPVTSAGYMVTMKPDVSGVVQRYRFENRNYTIARDLRGDGNNLNYRLLDTLLRGSEHALAEFLEYYPIYRKDADALVRRMSELVGLLYQSYGLRYKAHEMIFIDSRLHKFLSEIHENVYLARLKGAHRTVQSVDIMEYLMSLPTAKVLYLLNH